MLPVDRRALTNRLFSATLWFMGVLDKLAGAKRPSEIAKHGAKAKFERPANAKPVLRGPDGRLLPGSGAVNPGGRPKGIEQGLRELYARAGGDDLIEGVIAGEVTLPDGERQVVRDIRLRVETARWVHERANGKALERSASVNVDIPGGEAALPLDQLPEAILDGLLTAMSPKSLPEGAIEGEFRPADLPGTDHAGNSEDK